MGVLDYSIVAANNAIQPGIDWSEGMRPGQVNASARQVMADLATWLKSPSFPEVDQILLKGKSLKALSQISGDNLWYNPDMQLGDPTRKLVANDGLDVVGLKGYVAQQVTLSPFMSVTRTLTATGGYAVRFTNGLPSFTSVSIGTGLKSFDVGPGLNFVPGIDVTAAYADDVTQTMSGTVVLYNGSVLTIDVTATNGSGTRDRWAIGRLGTTKQGQTFKTTTTATSSNTLTFADTSGIQRGSAIETSASVRLPKATYVVDKTATTVTMSAPPTSPIPAGTQITFYGNQGVFFYQNIQPEDAGGFKFGTPAARTSYLSFTVRSRFITGIASTMFLGYSSLSTLGRSMTQAFPVTETETRQSLPMPGDTVPTSGVWQAGYDATGYPYAALGFAWESQGTPTAQNIPVGAWSSTFAVGGSDQQTLDLGSVVGAWVEVSDIKLEFDAPTPYDPPNYVRHPYPDFTARAPSNPRYVWEATRNPAGFRKVQGYLRPDGSLIFQGLTDDETFGSDRFLILPDGKLQAPAYPAGLLSFGSAGEIISNPSGFQLYNITAQPANGTSTFGDLTAYYMAVGKLVFVNISVQVLNVGTGSGPVTVELPFLSDGIRWVFDGLDTNISGGPLYGFVPPSSQFIQIRNAAGGYPAQNGSVLTMNGFYQRAG